LQTAIEETVVICADIYLILSNGKLLTETLKVQGHEDVPRRHGDVQRNRRPVMLANVGRK
jgi:hypothetical protein